MRRLWQKTSFHFKENYTDILEIENRYYVTFIVDEGKIQIVNSRTFIENNIHRVGNKL